MMTFLAAFGASYLFIALKALQQRQVIHDEYMMILPTSMAMAACEVLWWRTLPTLAGPLRWFWRSAQAQG